MAEQGNSGNLVSHPDPVTDAAYDQALNGLKMQESLEAIDPDQQSSFKRTTIAQYLFECFIAAKERNGNEDTFGEEAEPWKKLATQMNTEHNLPENARLDGPGVLKMVRWLDRETRAASATRNCGAAPRRWQWLWDYCYGDNVKEVRRKFFSDHINGTFLKTRA